MDGRLAERRDFHDTSSRQIIDVIFECDSQPRRHQRAQHPVNTMDEFGKPQHRRRSFLTRALRRLRVRIGHHRVTAVEASAIWKTLASLTVGGLLITAAMSLPWLGENPALRIAIGSAAWLLTLIWLRPVHVQLRVQGRHPSLELRRKFLHVLPLATRRYELNDRSLRTGTFEVTLSRVTKGWVREPEDMPEALGCALSAIIPFFVAVRGIAAAIDQEREPDREVKFRQRRLGLLLHDQTSGTIVPVVPLEDEAHCAPFLKAIETTWPDLISRG